MSDIRLVAADLDGTMLNSESKMDAHAAREILEICGTSLAFTFISGRPRYAIDRFAEEMNISVPIVSCNGAVIYQNDEILVKHSFFIHPLKPLMTAASAIGCTVLYYSDDIEYAIRETPWVRMRIQAGRNYPIQDLFTLGNQRKTAEKVNIIALGGETQFNELKPYIESLQKSYEIVTYGNQGCEIVAKGVNKATGLKELAEIMGISLGRIMAVGDNENDLAMLQEAGCSAAVGNATISAKQAAKYVCGDSYTQGVLEAVRFALGRC